MKFQNLRTSVSLILSIPVLILCSCQNSSNKLQDSEGTIKVSQQNNGSISLHLDKAICYHNRFDPSLNTAEWKIVISKPGRYQVWITSAAKDTMNLGYKTPVTIDLNGDRLEVKPVGNKIIKDASNVKEPYFRADSYMGSFYIQQPGEYQIQVISEKIIAHDRSNWQNESVNTMLMSVMLTPM